MNTRLPRLACLAWTLAAGFVHGLAGQEMPPKEAAKKEQAAAAKPATPPPAKLDALSEKTLARWYKLQAHPGRAGVRRVRFGITVTSRGGMTGTWKGQGTFCFDAASADRDGVLTWEDEEVADALSRRGWTAKAFARDFDPDPIRRRMRGRTVTATARDNGTILTAEDPDKPGETRYWLFDKPGLLAGTMAGPMRTRYLYEEDKGRYTRTGETFSMDGAAGELTIWHRKVQGFRVPVKLREIDKVKGQVLSDLTFVFHDLVLNDGPDPRGGKAKPTSRPTGKPAVGKPPTKAGKGAPPDQPRPDRSTTTTPCQTISPA